MNLESSSRSKYAVVSRSSAFTASAVDELDVNKKLLNSTFTGGVECSVGYDKPLPEGCQQN